MWENLLSIISHTLVKGRPPSSTMHDAGVENFHPGSKIYAEKLTANTNITIISAYRLDRKLTDLQEITRVRAKENGEWSPLPAWVHETLSNECKEEFDAVCECPWICPWPYVISDWNAEKIRIESCTDNPFWCDVEKNMLAEPVVCI